MDNQTKLEQLAQLLGGAKAEFEISQHEQHFKTASEGAQHAGIGLDESTPTLILKSKDQYIAVIICGNTRISFKQLKKALGLKDLSMADPQTVMEITGAQVGEVCLINTGLTTVIDSQVLKLQYCHGGCGVPQSTLKINTQDLLRITQAQVLEFTEPRS